jgi:hypothetical protein
MYMQTQPDLRRQRAVWQATIPPTFDADGRPIHPTPPPDHRAHTLAATLVAAFAEDRANDPDVLLDPMAADRLWRRYATAAELIEPTFAAWIVGERSQAEAASFGIGGAR